MHKSEAGEYCPWPLMSDGWAHEVRHGCCMNCGGQVTPIPMPALGPGLWREGHYALIQKKEPLNG